MNILRIKAVAKKELIHIRRDPQSLAMAIIIPVMLVLLFGSSLSLDVDNVPLVIWDQSNTPLSRDYISRFAASPYFAVTGYVDSYQDIERAIDRRQALIALVIPRDFARDLDRREIGQVQLLLDGSDANTATIALGYAQAVTAEFNSRVLVQRLSSKVALGSGGLDARVRVWFNEELAAKNYIVPGLIAVIMTIIAALLTSLTVAREWETGTMELLISTPVTAKELIVGKTAPYFVIGIIDVILAMVVAELVFAVPMRGSRLLLLGLSAVLLVSALMLGILVSVVAKSQLLASQLTLLSTALPSFLLSGLMYPITNMPQVLQWLTQIVPARYAVSIFKDVCLKGSTLAAVSEELGFLLLFALILVVTATAKFKKRLV